MTLKGAKVYLAAAVALLAAGPALAAECSDGQELGPGESCQITIRWGHDHWVAVELPPDGGHSVAFAHRDGQCNVALFGPEEADFGGEQAALGPESPLVETTVSGEYHLFTRAITVAQQDCTFEVSVK